MIEIRGLRRPGDPTVLWGDVGHHGTGAQVNRRRKTEAGQCTGGSASSHGCINPHSTQRTAMGMPLAHYPDVPSIRYQPIQGGVNMESRAAALQQSPLPGGFAGEGLARARKPFLRLFCARGRIVWNLPAIDASPILASSHKPLQTLAKFAPAKKCRPLRPIKEAG